MKKNGLKMRFSICMPVYNGAKVISPTIRSILSQSFSNFDLIMVNDCSKDNIEEVVKSFKDKRIKYYTKSFAIYIRKWGKDDLDIKKQFGPGYRYLGVFIENGKWKKLLAHPILVAGMFALRFIVGLTYLFS